MTSEAVQRDSSRETVQSGSASSDLHSETGSTSAASTTADGAPAGGPESAERLEEAATEVAGAESDPPSTLVTDAADSAAADGADAAASARSAMVLRLRPTEATLADLGMTPLGIGRGVGEG
jgi:hypothetical protein